VLPVLRRIDSSLVPRDTTYVKTKVSQRKNEEHSPVERHVEREQLIVKEKLGLEEKEASEKTEAKLVSKVIKKSPAFEKAKPQPIVQEVKVEVPKELIEKIENLEGEIKNIRNFVRESVEDIRASVVDLKSSLLETNNPFIMFNNRHSSTIKSLAEGGNSKISLEAYMKIAKWINKMLDNFSLNELLELIDNYIEVNVLDDKLGEILRKTAKTTAKMRESGISLVEQARNIKELLDSLGVLSNEVQRGLKILKNNV